MEGGLKESRGREGRMEELEGIWFGLRNVKWRRIGRGEGGWMKELEFGSQDFCCSSVDEGKDSCPRQAKPPPSGWPGGWMKQAGGLSTLFAVLSESTLATCFPIFILSFLVFFIPSLCLFFATIHAQSFTSWLMIFLSSPS